MTIKYQKRTLVTHPKEITEDFCSFYKSVYQSEKPPVQNIQQYNAALQHAQIMEEYKQIMDQLNTESGFPKFITNLKIGSLHRDRWNLS